MTLIELLNECLDFATEMGNEYLENEITKFIRESDRYTMFIRGWNDNRGQLPKVASLTDKRKRAIARLIADYGGDPDTAYEKMVAAVTQVRDNDFWREKKYGFDNLVPHNVDKWAERAPQVLGVEDIPESGSLHIGMMVYAAGAEATGEVIAANYEIGRYRVQFPGGVTAVFPRGELTEVGP
jgi:hypothetical protein